MADLDGPRLEPRSGTARQLVVFLHGYGADGNDLIDIGRAWQQLLPDAAFVSPHAPRPCGQAPMGREWFPLTFRDPNERWTGVNAAAPVLNGFIDAELKRREGISLQAKKPAAKPRKKTAKKTTRKTKKKKTTGRKKNG
jgi:phospholipase/carboxylesterase